MQTFLWRYSQVRKYPLCESEVKHSRFTAVLSGFDTFFFIKHKIIFNFSNIFLVSLEVTYKEFQELKSSVRVTIYIKAKDEVWEMISGKGVIERE